MITVQFGVVYKKANSTFTGGSGSHNVTLQCVLKENSSVLSPSLFVDIDGNTLFSGGVLNHAYISIYDRFYFVTNWTFERGRWRADLTIDVLASWKNSIGSSWQYVLRSESASDGKIFDSLYPVKNQISVDTSTDTFTWDVSGGYYILGIISARGMGLGAVGYYALTQSQLFDLCKYLFNDIGTNGYFSLTEIAQDMSMSTFKALYNPFQYIVSAMYLPFDMSGQQLSQQYIDVGYWTIPVTGGRLVSLVPRNISLSLPWAGSHPQANRGSYVYCNPYTEVDLELQPFGHFQLPADIVKDAGGVDVVIKVDYITGRGTAYIGGLIAPYMTVDAQVGVPIQLAQMSTDYLAAAVAPISSAANAAQNIFSGNVGGAISDVATGIDSSIRAQVPRLMSSGGNGALSGLVHVPTAIFRYYSLADDSPMRLGKPLCAQRQISSLSGYILCKNAAVDTAGTESENNKIVEYMNGGFYYE